MNDTLHLILNRRSIRAYAERPIGAEDKDLLLQATLRAPTAGNMMLYSIIEVEEQAAKDVLADFSKEMTRSGRAILQAWEVS